MAKSKAKKQNVVAKSKAKLKKPTRVAEKGKTSLKSAKPVKVMAKKASAQKQEQTQRDDIINLILDDHKALKSHIHVMKDVDSSIDERQREFDSFAQLLILHARPEERTMYAHLKKENDTREVAFEGEVEHAIALQLIEEIQSTDNDDLWSARVKVLAELVERHLEEEEGELIPDFRKQTAPEARAKMAKEFVRIKEEIQDGNIRPVIEEGEIEEDEETEEMLSTMR